MKKFYSTLLMVALTAGAAAAQNTVFIGEEGYATVPAAVAKAQSGETVLVKANQDNMKRASFVTSCTVTGDNAGITLHLGETGKQNFLVGSKTALDVEATISNLILDGNTADGTAQTFASAMTEPQNGTCRAILENVTIKNYTIVPSGTVRGVVSGRWTANNVKCENCSGASTETDFAAYIAGCKITGDNDFSLFLYADKLPVDAEGVKNSKPMQVKLNKYMAEGTVVFTNCTNPDNFFITNYDLHLESDGTNLVIKKGKAESGIEGIEAAEAAPARYYNIQGVEVAEDNLTTGIYIRRQGNKATKVVIK